VKAEAARWNARKCRDLTKEDADRLFFHKSHELHAKRLCAGCPARRLCLERALELARADEAPNGVWGGLNAAERQELLS
jgi:hypothetical protein